MLLCACTAGCTAHELVPALSLHAALVLHRRDQDARERSRDTALSLQLAFGGARARPHAVARREPELSPLAQERAPACEETALCEWARMAEEAALDALGVRP